MNHKLGAIYRILLESDYGIWTINSFKGHLVLKDFSCHRPISQVGREVLSCPIGILKLKGRGLCIPRTAEFRLHDSEPKGMSYIYIYMYLFIYTYSYIYMYLFIYLEKWTDVGHLGGLRDLAVECSCETF